MKITEYVFVSGDSCETFCKSCGQLRLWGKPEKPTGCGNCGSSDFVVGPVLGAELPKLREEWIALRMKRYSCLKPFGHSELDEPLPCGEPERYRAKGNGARYGHLCEEHWLELADDEQGLYAPVGSERDFNLAEGVPTVFLDLANTEVVLTGTTQGKR